MPRPSRIALLAVLTGLTLSSLPSCDRPAGFTGKAFAQSENGNGGGNGNGNEGNNGGGQGNNGNGGAGNGNGGGQGNSGNGNGNSGNGGGNSPSSSSGGGAGGSARSGGEQKSAPRAHTNPLTGDRIRVEGPNIEIIHRNGITERIRGGRYEMRDSRGRVIVNRASTERDRARLDRMRAGAR